MLVALIPEHVNKLFPWAGAGSWSFHSIVRWQVPNSTTENQPHLPGLFWSGLSVTCSFSIPFESLSGFLNPSWSLGRMPHQPSLLSLWRRMHMENLGYTLHAHSECSISPRRNSENLPFTLFLSVWNHPPKIWNLKYIGLIMVRFFSFSLRQPLWLPFYLYPNNLFPRGSWLPPSTLAASIICHHLVLSSNLSPERRQSDTP